MVRAGRYSGYLCAVLSGLRSAAVAGGEAASADAKLSCRRLQLPESQAQNLLRAQAEALRRCLSKFLRHRSAAALQRACGFKSQLLSPSTASPVTQCRVPVD